MFGGEPVADRKGAKTRRPPGFRDHAAMARDGAGAIAAAVEKEENPVPIRPRRDRELTGRAAGGDLSRTMS